MRTQPGPWLADVYHHHAQGLEFKLHPSHSTATRQQLAGEHGHMADFCREAWLWLESRRLRRSFCSIREYVECGITKCPETVQMRNRLVNAKLFGARSSIGAEANRHPRERVLNTFPILLWQPHTVTSPATQGFLQTQLRTTAGNFSGLVAAYRQIWSRVN